MTIVHSEPASPRENTPSVHRCKWWLRPALCRTVAVLRQPLYDHPAAQTDRNIINADSGVRAFLIFIGVKAPAYVLFEKEIYRHKTKQVPFCSGEIT